MCIRDSAFRARHHPGAQPFDITAHLVKIGAAGFGAAAVQQKAACRCNISCSAAAQQSVAGKQRLDLIGALVQLFCIDSVVQTHHHFVRTGSIRLHQDVYKRQEFKEYARKIVENAQALAAELQARGVKLVSGGTDNHLMLIDLRDEECTGKELEADVYKRQAWKSRFP